MKDIFVLADKKEYYTQFYSYLSSQPFHFSWASRVDETIKLLSIEKPAYIFLVTQNLEIMTDWITILKNGNYQIPFICFTSRILPEERKMLWEQDALNVIQLPIHKAELEKILKFLLLSNELNENNGSGKELEGSLEEMNLIDLIQTIQDEKRTCKVILDKGTLKGEVEFNKGKVVNARYNNENPVLAIKIMSHWMKGRFYIHSSKRSFSKRVKLPNQKLILECLDHINKQNELMNRLKFREELLFAKPDLSFEDIAPFERNNLLKFKNGYTIKELVDGYGGDGIVLLQHVSKWLRTKSLLKNSEYEKRLKDVQDIEGMSGFKKMMNKIMGTPDDDLVEAALQGNVLSVEEEVLKNVNKKDQLFNNNELLNNFLTSLEDSGA
jgi:hypothetical protein